MKYVALVLIALVIIVVASGAFAWLFLGLQNVFPVTNVDLGGHSIRVRPASVVRNVGSKFGLPLFEMQDTFFVSVSYKCDIGSAGEVEIVKDGELVPASPLVLSDGRCFKNFGSEQAMSGKLTARLIIEGKAHEKSVLLEKKLEIMSPLLRRLLSQ